MRLFTLIRIWAYMAVIASSTVVLGLSANFASKFLPSLHRDFAIFSLVAPSFTIVVLILMLLRSQPRLDVLLTFIMAVFWLTMGAWSVDIIGHVECFALGSQRMPIANGGTMSAQQYCREMKAIEAFSWANFVVLISAFLLLIVLTTRVQSLGRHHAWAQSISDLPWFGEMHEAYDGQPYGYGYPQPYPPQAGYVVHQQPGHSVLIQQGQGGHAPNIQQVAGTVVSA
ncbi:hypothetical protein JB92DRAFT_3029854 [Gautieria morchelliformis]|nr:hypothetical protein JB92DRAFT_3029854 [Gautieria morchelliformis]